jgi:pimeloyl-ACP methyl ester carboxylesterase
MNETRPIRVRVGEAELAVASRGQGPPLLFVHGFPFDHTMWRHQVESLEAWRRIAPDLRGVGASITPAGGSTMARYADDVVAILDALGIGRAAVCGQSMGGYVLFELLRRYPERVGAVALVATKPEADTADGQRARKELADLAVREGPDAVVERLLPKLLGRTTRANRPLVDEVRRMARRWSVPGMAAAQQAMGARPDATGTLRALRVPTLVIGGEEDEITPPPVVRAMGALIPNARVAIVPGAGHVVPLERPDDTTRALADFLAASAPGGSLA